jgi:hypothetical protein
MGEKQDLIKRMFEMQQKFIKYEQENGITGVEYYTPEAGHLLEGYHKEYAEMAAKVIDLAHAEAGSHR